MIKNNQRELPRFGSSMGCYLSLAQVYLEVACEVVHFSKKENELSMKSYTCFMMLYYAYDMHVMLCYYLL